MENERRSSDIRIDSLVTKVAAIEAAQKGIGEKLDENTKMTKEAVDVLKGFRLLGLVVGWITKIGVVVAAGYHGGAWLIENWPWPRSH